MVMSEEPLNEEASETQPSAGAVSTAQSDEAGGTPKNKIVTYEKALRLVTCTGSTPRLEIREHLTRNLYSTLERLETRNLFWCLTTSPWKHNPLLARCQPHSRTRMEVRARGFRVPLSLSLALCQRIISRSLCLAGCAGQTHQPLTHEPQRERPETRNLYSWFTAPSVAANPHRLHCTMNHEANTPNPDHQTPTDTEKSAGLKSMASGSPLARRSTWRSS